MSEVATFTRQSRLTIPTSVYARPFGDELVLLDFGRGEYFGLDEIGAEIWRGLEAGEPLGAIADGLSERYDVAVDAAFSDLTALVSTMQRARLVTCDDPVPGR